MRAVMTVVAMTVMMAVMALMAMMTSVVGADSPIMASMMTSVMMVYLMRE